MTGTSTGWQAISPSLIALLPEAPGVFSVGNLVRSVLYVGGVLDTGLRSAVARALERPDLRRQARSLRYELSDDPVRRQAEILGAYRAAHGGALPPAQPLPGPAPRRLPGPPAQETGRRTAPAGRAAAPRPPLRTVA